MLFKIVNTDNFGSDYPDEAFVNLPPMRREDCQHIADIVNERCGGPDARRFYKVVDEDYELQPGFQP